MKTICICGEPNSTARPYRIDFLVEALKSLGLESSWMTIPDSLHRSEEIAKSNLVILWRTAWDESVAAIVRAARSNGATIVFDADDLVIEPDIAQIEIIDGIRTQQLFEDEVRNYFRRTLASFEASDFACSSTEEIAAFMRVRGKQTFVLPNGFNGAMHERSRRAVRRFEAGTDKLVRIGYATGTHTHQRDFAVVASPLAWVLRAREHCRLVLFRDLLDASEFPELRGLESQIEWRRFVPHENLSEELARFDINIAPLEVGNPFCESKSELKFVQAALVNVSTIASATGPFCRAIRENETGFIANSETEWTSKLLKLIDDMDLRMRIGLVAYRDVLKRYGPDCRREQIAQVLPVWRCATHARE
jgi:glycosyltransferase involved in cell wall biosynthesis